MTQETFEREFGRRAEEVHAAPLSLTDVRGRAGAIRRRRRWLAAAGAVTAAVVLVAVVPMLLAGDPAKRSKAPEPMPPLPAHTAVLHDGIVTLSGGSTVDLGVDSAAVTQLGVLTDGRIVLAMQEPYGISVYGPDGTLQERYPAQTNAITMSPGRDAVAWVGEDFRVRVLTSGITEPATMAGVPMPGESPGSIDAVLAPDHLLVGDWNTTTGEITADGFDELHASQAFRVDDVSPDGSLWAVSYPAAADPQYGCSSLYDPQADQLVAKSCTTSGLRFAPDGQHLLGMRGDNNMYDHVDVLDLDLRTVATYTPDGSSDVVSRAAWVDASHLEISVANLDSNRWWLVRRGLDGTGTDTDVAPPADGRNPESVAEFVFSE